MGGIVERLTSGGRWPVVIGGGSQALRESGVPDVPAFPLEAMILRAGSVDSGIAEQCRKLGIPLILSGRRAAGMSRNSGRPDFAASRSPVTRRGGPGPFEAQGLSGAPGKQAPFRLTFPGEGGVGGNRGRPAQPLQCGRIAPFKWRGYAETASS